MPFRQNIDCITFCFAIIRKMCDTCSIPGLAGSVSPKHDLEMIMRYPLLVPLAIGTLLAACTEAPQDPAATPSTKTAITAAAPATSNSATPAPTAAVDQAALYQKAIAAERAGRLVAPAGDNAFELLLSLREQAPDNDGYRNALFDLMPLADQAIRHAIQQNDLAEADRITALMTRFDADSYVSQSSRERVADAQAKAAKAAALSATRERARTAEIAAAATPTAAPAVNPPPAPAQAAPVRVSDPEAVNALAGTKPAVQSAVVAAAQASLANPSSSNSDKVIVPVPDAETSVRQGQLQPAAAPGSSITAPVAMRRAPVQYPEQAKRQGVEGFVELDVLVDKAGNPTDIKVVRSQPSGLFDRAAIRAMMRWKFQPATSQGQPVAARTRTIIQFKKS